MKSFKINQSITDCSDICLKYYLRDIYSYPLLSPKEELEIAKLASTGDVKARNKLITSNLRFVVSVAKQYQNSSLALIDLINEGNIGLIKAIDKFDYEKGFKFISYAVWWIRQSIMQAISDKSRTIRIPTNQTSLILKMNKFIAQYEQDLNQTPTIEEIAEYLEVDSDKVYELQAISTYTVSVDSTFSDEDAGCLLDVIPNTNATNSDEEVLQESSKKGLYNILKTLPNREYDIIQMFFGLNGIYPMTFEEIGKRFNLTGERVRQIKEKVLKHLSTYKKQIENL